MASGLQFFEIFVFVCVLCVHTNMESSDFGKKYEMLMVMNILILHSYSYHQHHN
jgi:hypothetical protein